ncbi:MAG: preprotein translocase subunit YajC [Actinomycetes bacterium]|nr:MAG: preprotein translocase subunit YajC [Actinomycetota bacterium]
MNLFVLAQEQPAASPYSSLIFLVVMGAIFWLLIVRPQRKRMREQQELVSSLQVGQQVRTIGGIVGRIVSMDDESVVLEVEQGRIRVIRRAIGSRVGSDQA